MYMYIMYKLQQNYMQGIEWNNRVCCAYTCIHVQHTCICTVYMCTAATHAIAHNFHVNVQCIYMYMYTHQTYTSIQEYSVALHARARRGLEDILASEQECLAFRRTHLFNSDNSRMLSASLLSVLTRYLTAVRKHLQTLSLTHVSSGSSVVIVYVIQSTFH